VDVRAQVDLRVDAPFLLNLVLVVDAAPLIAGDAEFDEIEATLRRCLTAASEQLIPAVPTSRGDEEQPGEQWA
jgi:hypothetical protein